MNDFNALHRSMAAFAHSNPHMKPVQLEASALLLAVGGHTQARDQGMKDMFNTWCQGANAAFRRMSGADKEKMIVGIRDELRNWTHKLFPNS